MDFNSEVVNVALAFSVMTDPSFCERIILLKDYFIEYLPDALKWIFSRSLEYYGKYGMPIGVPVVVEELKKHKQRRTISKVLLEGILNLINQVEDAVEHNRIPSTEYTLEELLTFAKTQAIKSIVIKNAKMLESGDVDAFVEELNKLMNHFSSATTTTGEKLEDIQRRIQLRREGKNVRVPTGIPDLDALIGGLADGELGIILGPSGGGKTAFLIQVSIAGMMFGRNVSYVTLEMSPMQLLERIDAYISNVPMKKLVKEEQKVKDAVREFVNKVKAHLDVKQFPSGLTRVEDIDNYLKILKSEGISPGMLVVDYGELLSYKGEAYEGQGENFVKLRGLAVKWQIPVWVASQSNRPAWSKRIIRPDDIAESFRKVHVADVIIGLCRTEEEKRNKKVRFYVGKCRFEVDGFEVGPYTSALEKGRIIDFTALRSPQRKVEEEEDEGSIVDDEPFVKEEEDETETE
jgi:replicative DNA helicase